MKIKILTLLILSLLCCNAKAQLQPIFNIPSPEVAGLGEYGKVPVSLYTGIPDISIPLYEIKVGNYSLPLSTSYHVASVKANAQSGPLGLGWSLFAGGYITRSVHCVPDETLEVLGGGTVNERTIYRGFYYNARKIKNITPQNITEYSNDDSYELAADEFSFNFYRYDAGDQVIASKQPDSDWVYYVYDRAGRAVFSQTGNQRARGEWTFRIADKQGRECLMGTCNNKLDPFTEPVLPNYIGSVYVGSEGRFNGYKVYGAFLDSPVVYSTNDHDQYHFLDAGLIPAPDGLRFSATSGFPSPHTCARGLPTGTTTVYFDNTGTLGYEYRSLYNDSRDRVIQTRFRSHRSEVTTESANYNFTGLPLTRRVVYTETVFSSGTPTKISHNELYTYTYDSQGCLLTTKHRFDNGPTVPLPITDTTI